MKINNKAVTPPLIKTITFSQGMLLTDWLIALLPALIFGVCYFGVSTIIFVILSVLTVSVLEIAKSLILKRTCNLMLMVEGLVFSLCLSANAPLYLAPIGGGVIFILAFAREFHGKYLSYPPVLVLLTVVTLFVFHTPTPIDSVLLGSKSMSVKVIHLILGTHEGGLGSVSFLTALFGYIYLSLRKRIRPLIPLIFYVSLILGICIFYESTDHVTQLDYISYVIFDGKILFASVFLLTLPCVLPHFSKAPMFTTILLGVALAYLLVTLKNCDLVYPVITASAILSCPVSHIKSMVLRKG